MVIPVINQFYARRNVENEMSVLKSYTLTRRALSELDFTISYFTIGRVREPRLYDPHIKVELDTSLVTKKYHPVYISVIDEDRYILEINSQFKIKKIFRFGEPVRYPDLILQFGLIKNIIKKVHQLQKDANLLYC